MLKKTPKKKKKKKKLSAAEEALKRQKLQYRREIRSIFKRAGFERLAGVGDKEFTILGVTSDVDDVFIYENILVIAEYTTVQESDVSAHAKGKKPLFDAINDKPQTFLE